MTELRGFKQVDVFTDTPLLGNPLAVILDADGLSDQQMLAVARWTNLSETTFVLPPSLSGADYHVRIFSPSGELPFAGHPTLGTAHALLESGFKPKTRARLIQQCGIGLVEIDLSCAGQLAFQAPQAQIFTVNESYFPLLNAAVGGATRVTWSPPVVVDMGIRWLVVRADSAQACLQITPDSAALERLLRRCEANGLAIYGPHPADGQADYEVRAFVVELGALVEDPVTGSANACLARLLHAQGFPDNPSFAQSYRVRQGTALQRSGRLQVYFTAGAPWIAGQSVTVVNGSFKL
ncbi:PhzF family phenazine biosynthesis protein [Sodalis sp. RH21]|uniref:PhzF family phenazine biosynthesis protein n=1 Tax=unclassified Sodalis (in: enterobacteria) TaxID=2636512 RepID=UPI0039B3A387